MAEVIEDYFIKQLQENGQYITEELSGKQISDEVKSKVPYDLAKQFHLLPLKEENGELYIVTDSPQSFKQRGYIERSIGMSFRFLFADTDNLKRALFNIYGIKSYRQTDFSTSDIQAIEDLTPIQASVNQMLQDGAMMHASDIHILPRPNEIIIRFRINGRMHVMTDKYNFPANQASSVVNIIKQLDTSGKVDITVHNRSNEGSFQISHNGKSYRMRMETMPEGNEGEYEYINLRYLPQGTSGDDSHKTLDSIGYSDEDLKAIKDTLFQNSTGLFINSGPTGAGKTTSLYAQIHFVLDSRNEMLNVITIDDPIEIRDYEFTQIQIREAQNSDLDFSMSKIFKSTLRSDPDIFLWNEIRDAKEAQFALYASSTGHPVFSTIHAGDCIRTILRLLDLDVSKVTLLSELKMIICQRLVGKLCPHCSRPHELTELEKNALKPSELALLLSNEIRDIGSPEDIEKCPHCDHGITGRMPIAEYIIFNNRLRDVLLSNPDFTTVSHILADNGFKSMWSKGLNLVKDGQISLSELIHIVGPEQR